MKRLLAIVITCCICTLVNAQNRWALQDDGSIRWDITAAGLPHYDHIEMSGQYISTVIRYGVNADQSFFEERSLVFPMLRTIPNDTHASLTHRIATDIPSLLSINGKTLQQEKVQSISIHGSITVESTFTLSNHESGDDIAMTRIIFPSYDAPALCEIYKVKNLSQKAICQNSLLKQAAFSGYDRIDGLWVAAQADYEAGCNRGISCKYYDGVAMAE